MIYYNGLKIYSAEDTDLQEQAESIFSNSEIFAYDPDLEVGFYMMDYSGRVLAIIGSSGEKTGNRWMSYATDSTRQVGSTMKPISVYTPAMENGFIGYSTTLSDDAIPNYFDDGTAGPDNWYNDYYTNGSRGNMAVYKAMEISANRPAANLCKTITPQLSYQFMTENLHITSLTEDDSYSISAMALGGMTNGITVKEMTAAFQIFGNSGQYQKPYTYYYVTDNDGNVILDNRNQKGEQAVSAGVAEVMNKVLQQVIYGSEGTYSINSIGGIDGWTIYGKTGTTDGNKDSWFVGGTPCAVAGIWTGYTEPSELTGTSLTAARVLWRQVMTYYLNDKEVTDFDFSDITEASLCTSSGKVASSGCSSETGWVPIEQIDNYCDGTHTLYRGGSSMYSSVGSNTSTTTTTTTDPEEESTEEEPDTTGEEETTAPVEEETTNPEPDGAEEVVEPITVEPEVDDTSNAA
jgi:penicillin-binding protein 1A